MPASGADPGPELDAEALAQLLEHRPHLLADIGEHLPPEVQEELGATWQHRGGRRRRKALDAEHARTARLAEMAAKPTLGRVRALTRANARTSLTVLPLREVATQPQVTAHIDPEPPAGEPPACGTTWVMRSRFDARHVRVMRLSCGRRSCPGCRPRWEAEAAEHFGACFDAEGELVHRTIVSATGWATLSRRISRAGAKFVRTPTAGGRFVVLSTLPLGELLAPEQVRPALAHALAAVPAARDERAGNVTSSRCWAMTHGPDESRWEALGMLGDGVDVDRVVRAARMCEMPVIPVDAAALPPGVTAAVDLLAPADPNDPRWERFVRMVRMAMPEPPAFRAARRRRWDEREAAAS